MEGRLVHFTLAGAFDDAMDASNAEAKDASRLGGALIGGHDLIGVLVTAAAIHRRHHVQRTFQLHADPFVALGQTRRTGRVGQTIGLVRWDEHRLAQTDAVIVGDVLTYASCLRDDLVEGHRPAVAIAHTILRRWHRTNVLYVRRLEGIENAALQFLPLR